jgi:hypothetical protein
MFRNKKGAKYGLANEKRFQERQSHCQLKSKFSVTIELNHAYI